MDYHNRLLKLFTGIVQHYNDEKYWKMRDYLQSYNGKANSLKALYYLYKVKKMDAYANASTGICLGTGSAVFETHPRLPHGLYGIIIAPGTRIGKNVRICQQVTIGNDFRDKTHTPVIGDNVEIYPGAKIVGRVTIGNEAKIGANVVITEDVPPRSTVVVNKPRIIIREESDE